MRLGELSQLSPGQFVGFHTYRCSDVYCLGMQRQRDPPVAVLAHCRLMAGKDAESTWLALSTTADTEELRFSTSYDIARELILASESARPSHPIEMIVFDVENDIDLPLCVRVTGRSLRELRRQTAINQGARIPSRGGAGLYIHAKYLIQGRMIHGEASLVVFGLGSKGGACGEPSDYSCKFAPTA